ncbi:MAG: CPBP family intramembrane glutamic endopeptidase [Acholeplasmataceae bacterium]
MKRKNSFYLDAYGIYTFYAVYLYLFGLYYARFPSVALLGYSFKPTSWLVWLLLVLIMVYRKQEPRSVGFTRNNLGKSSLWGFLIGMVFLLVVSVISIRNGLRFIGSDFLLFGFIYYFFEIGLTEEWLFRGFIQTRLVGFYRHKMVGIVITGILFSLIHVPFQMSLSGLGFFEHITRLFEPYSVFAASRIPLI